MSAHVDRLQGARVLIISSNEAIRSQIEYATRRWQMTPYQATSVTGALWALAEGERIDVAVVDTQLPGMSGTPFAERIGSLDLPFDVPIVSIGITESRASVPVDSQNWEGGVTISVPKPMSVEGLRIALVRSLCACVECRLDTGERGRPPGPLPEGRGNPRGQGG